MSAAPAEKKPIRRQNESPNAELMRALGAQSYTAMPRDQHEWQKTDAEHNPPLHRLWSWMVHHTLTWGHTTVDGESKAYATSKDGVELHLEHAAKDLGMDRRNLHRAWREGVALGLWRYGAAQEGRRKLILCGKVAPPKEVPEDQNVVCTDDIYPCLGRLPPYVRDQILSRSAEEVKQITRWYARYTEVERVALADVMAAGRAATAKLAAEGWQSFGIEIRRLDTVADQDRTERLSALLPQVEQLVNTVAAQVAEPPDPDLETQVAEAAAALSRAQSSVQTISRSVQRSENASYRDESGAVQTEKRAPTLLPASTTRRSQQAGSRGIRGKRASAGADPNSDGREAVQVHAGGARLLSQLTTEERAGAENLLASIAEMQRKQPRKWTGEAANTEDRGHLTTAAKIVRTVSLAELDAFTLYIQTKTVERSLGYPLKIALLPELAAAFCRGAAERERQRQAAAQQEQKREAFRRAAEENRRREDELVERTEHEWELLPITAKIQRLKTAGQELKADPHFASVYKNNAEERAHQTELRAKRALRREIQLRLEELTRAATGGDQ